MVSKVIDNYNSPHQKLNLVKGIKDFSGEGLKWSKELMDNLSLNIPISITAYKNQEELNRFKSYMSNVDCRYTLDDVSYFRNKKLFELCIYEKSDIVDALVENDVSVLYNDDGRINVERLKEVLTSRYSLISEDDMKKLMND